MKSFPEQLRLLAIAVDKDRGFETGLTDDIRKAADEIERLTRWKVEAEAVEQSWNPQAIAMLLRLPLGSNIRAAIQPAIERLGKEISDADSAHSKTLIEFGKLRIQNERFRQALLAIANQVTVDYLLSDKDIARLALEEANERSD